jgi:predicted phage gp36 major capsid-like protein
MNPPRNEDTLMRDPDMTIEARLKVDPDFATALYHEQRKRIAELEKALETLMDDYQYNVCFDHHYEAARKVLE